MPDQQQLVGIFPGSTPELDRRPPDTSSIDIELGEIAAAVMRRERIGDISLSNDTCAALAARLERAQAARWVGAVRAAGEAVPVASAPAITPDTVWSGEFATLVELFKVSLYRVNTTAAYLSERPRCAGTPVGFLSHDKP